MPHRQRNVLLVISSLGAGGAERILVLLAQGLKCLGHQVSVVTIFERESDFYSLPEGVHRVALDQGGATTGIAAKIVHNGRRISALRRAVREQRPDTVISFLSSTNVLVLLAAAGLRVPVIVTEHIDPRRHSLPRAWHALRRACYGRAAALVSVSQGVDAGFRWLPQQRRVVIHNPICWQQIQAAGGDRLALACPRTVIAMGRLTEQKGFDLLITAFAQLSAEFRDWGLAILGEGSQRPQLESLVASFSLTGRVQLPGALRDPMPTLKQADLFVLSSRYEGFGNVLVEAMACGLPVLAADCDSGPREIIRSGVDGVLVPPDDIAALAGAMSDLMADDDRRARLGREAREASRRFDLDRVMVAWESLLQSVCDKRAG